MAKDKKFKFMGLDVVVTDKKLKPANGDITQIIGIGGKNSKTDKIAMMLVNETKKTKKG